MKIKFWGVRGSIPSPSSTEEYQEKLSSILWRSRRLSLDSENLSAEPNEEDLLKIEAFVSDLPPELNTIIGGNTPCIQILPSDNETIIVDGGSGLRLLGLELMKSNFGRGEGHGSIFISHSHWDHIHGIPFFDPLFIAGNVFDFYGVHGDLEERLSNQQEPAHFPIKWRKLASEKNIKIFNTNETIKIGKTSIRAHELSHPGSSYSFRFEDEDGGVIVYASDAEYKHLEKDMIEEHLKFFRRADILIFDTQYALNEIFNREDWGHSSAFIGLEMAVEAEVQQLVMFHHEPSHNDKKLFSLLRKTEEYSDIIKKHKRHKCRIHLAKEGMILDTNSID